MNRRTRHALTMAVALAGLAGAATGPAFAQSVTAAFQDFSGHSKQPVHIEADRLDVRQSDQAAVFTGRVVVVQGQSTLRTKSLTIDYYDTNQPGNTKSTSETRQVPGKDGAAAAASAPAKSGDDGGPGNSSPAAKGHPKGASPLPSSSRDIRRLIAVGNVVVTSGDQRATGNRGVFDMASNTVTLTGDVILTQGENVLRGTRLVVDLTTQHSRLESSGEGGRVQGVFVPGQGQPGQGPAGAGQHEAPHHHRTGPAKP
jgi:lipopolysaccharide export system protein LptA